MTARSRHSAEPGQLPLEFSHDVALGQEDFFISSSNETAYGLIEAWPNWPKRRLMLIGPAGSGKTHLATIWRHAANARVVRADELSLDGLPELVEADALVVEDLPGPNLDDTVLFHLLNLLAEHGRDLLMTATEHPARWPVALPDLASRLRAVPTVELGPPDEALLRAVLVKLFADRQLMVEEAVLSFLLARMERSLADAAALVDTIDRRALAERSKVTRPFVAKALKDTEFG